MDIVLGVKVQSTVQSPKVQVQSPSTKSKYYLDLYCTWNVKYFFKVLFSHWFPIVGCGCLLLFVCFCCANHSNELMQGEPPEGRVNSDWCFQKQVCIGDRGSSVLHQDCVSPGIKKLIPRYACSLFSLLNSSIYTTGQRCSLGRRHFRREYLWKYWRDFQNFKSMLSGIANPTNVLNFINFGGGKVPQNCVESQTCLSEFFVVVAPLTKPNQTKPNRQGYCVALVWLGCAEVFLVGCYAVSMKNELPLSPTQTCLEDSVSVVPPPLCSPSVGSWLGMAKWKQTNKNKARDSPRYTVLKSTWKVLDHQVLFKYSTSTCTVLSSTVHQKDFGLWTLYLKYKNVHVWLPICWMKR